MHVVVEEFANLRAGLGVPCVQHPLLLLQDQDQSSILGHQWIARFNGALQRISLDGDAGIGRSQSLRIFLGRFKLYALGIQTVFEHAFIFAGLPPATDCAGHELPPLGRFGLAFGIARLR